MKSAFVSSSLLLLCCALSAQAEPWGFIRVGDQRRSEVRAEVREAVEAHRAAKREEIRREEAAVGRRLTPAELVELRQQVRQQWVPRQDPRQELIHSAESQPAERLMPPPGSNLLTAPRSQRP
ncbi:hypothetical protein [Variovorax sp. JS1663]|uniref:hypothetical protein n=1 Tax=Variovorax sp. JS1663 TaxID=1851577 RepID=UPI000B65C8D3|nr:hypothetical protein [Variovorax sp. JS1663]OUM01131.1 hypothetical protein A8M77_17680 [Variovorax sp. JS1663]